MNQTIENERDLHASTKSRPRANEVHHTTQQNPRADGIQTGSSARHNENAYGFRRSEIPAGFTQTKSAIRRPATS